MRIFTSEPQPTMRKQFNRGRRIKRDYPRTEILKIRISAPHKDLLNRIRKEYDSTIVSQADIVEWAVARFANDFSLLIDPDASA